MSDLRTELQATLGDGYTLERELGVSPGADMMSARVTAGSPIAIASPAPLFHIADDLLKVEFAFYTPWDVAADGRFIMARTCGDEGNGHVGRHRRELADRVAREDEAVRTFKGAASLKDLLNLQRRTR
jgi:hypothetical protein